MGNHKSGRHPLPLDGRRFDRVVALRRVGTGRTLKSALWECRCDCDRIVVVSAANLVKARRRSCGCDRSPVGSTFDPAYRPWHAMVTRCTNARHSSFVDYGAKGIRVCERWLSFQHFRAEMGPRPSKGHSIDRIDPAGNYEPGNCRWATKIEQGRNTRRKAYVVVGGAPMRIFEAAAKLGVSVNAVQHRVKRGVLKKFAIDCDNALRDATPEAAPFCAGEQVCGS